MKLRYVVVLLLSLVLLAFLPVTSFAAEPVGGVCGNLTWELDENGWLYIEGNGTMADFASVDSAPWSHLASSVEAIEIGPGVTTIGENAFFDFELLTTLILPDSLTQIGSAAFFNCGELTWILNSELEQTLPNSVQVIEDAAFCGCDSLTNLALGTAFYRLATVPSAAARNWRKSRSRGNCSP